MFHNYTPCVIIQIVNNLPKICFYYQEKCIITKARIMNANNKQGINPYILVILSFLVVILLGSVLLVMPWCQVDGHWANYIDSLLAAFSATCVTGITAYANGVADTLTFGGQIVLLVMIQIGGLGFITILTFIITTFKHKLEFRNRYFISQMVNSTSFADVVNFVRKIIIITFTIELIGAILYFPAFYTIFSKSGGNVGDAIWYSIFHSISSFNNAGFDLMHGTSSFIRSADSLLNYLPTGMYYYFCCVAMLLIILGGISFLVIIDVFNFKKKPSQWRSFTKAVLLTNAALLLGGALLIFLTDGFKGPGAITPFQAIFQSVTCRTAGFATYNQDNLSIAGKAISCFLMLIGGSPLSTAGGIKTTTLFMIGLASISYFRGRKVQAFKRSFSTTMIVKALVLLLLAIIVLLISYLVIVTIGFDSHYSMAAIAEAKGIKSTLNEAVIYDVFSCFGTVGLSIGIEPYLHPACKLILCVLMFLGRLGPMTFFQVFQANIDKEEVNHYKLVEEDILIG